MSTPDVVIIGAGAAGVGAGLALQARGVSFVILEAADRIGGRAFTDTVSLGTPWDQGCHWLHCADVNPLVAWADKLGSTYVEQNDEGDPYSAWQGGTFVASDADDPAERAVDAAFEAVYAAGKAGQDVPITDVMPDLGRWKAGADCVMALMAGDEPADISAAAYADYSDTEADWPVISGYGDLITRMAKDLPIRTGTIVTKIEQLPDGARVHTADSVIDTRAVIVTVSTNVINAGKIHFGPGPAADLAAQLVHIPCGAYEKVAFRLKSLPPALEGKRFCNVDPGDGRPAISYQTMLQSDVPVVIAHYAGDIARETSEAGPDAMIAYATDLLRMAFGDAAVQDITAVEATNWTQNPFVLGSYSHARPGYAQLRRDLIAADTGNVAFAGEAFSLHWEATAHGAYQTGQDAAARIADRLA